MRAVTCIGMNARVKPPYDPAKDEDYWGLRRALAYVSGARGDEILTRYDEWRATPRPNATRVFVGPARSFKRPRSEDGSPRRLAWVKDEFGRRLGGLRWVGRGFAEFQTGLLLWCGQGYAPALNRAASLLERRCARAHDPLVADGRDRDGIRRVITPLEWADLVLIDAGSGPEVYDCARRDRSGARRRDAGLLRRAISGRRCVEGLPRPRACRARDAAACRAASDAAARTARIIFSAAEKAARAALDAAGYRDAPDAGKPASGLPGGS